MQPLVNAVMGLEGQHEGPDPLQILPAFLPVRFIESASWNGPFSQLPAPGVVLAWAVSAGGESLRYVTKADQRQWDSLGVDWRTQALQNVRALSGEPLGTGALFREDGETWLISLMYPDGLGPSRLLLTEELSRMFPGGYRVALPEQNRGFAFARQLDRVDLDTVENLVQRSYLASERPLSPAIFEPADLVDPHAGRYFD